MRWFPSKRKLAADTAIHCLRPMIAHAQINGGMSFLMWQDPYLLGFMKCAVLSVMMVELRGKVGEADIVAGFREALTLTSNMNGALILENMDELDSGDDEGFASGSKDAAVMHFYMEGTLRDELAGVYILMRGKL